jgi:hypothetical protein
MKNQTQLITLIIFGFLFVVSNTYASSEQPEKKSVFLEESEELTGLIEQRNKLVMTISRSESKLASTKEEIRTLSSDLEDSAEDYEDKRERLIQIGLEIKQKKQDEILQKDSKSKKEDLGDTLSSLLDGYPRNAYKRMTIDQLVNLENSLNNDVRSYEEKKIKLEKAKIEMGSLEESILSSRFQLSSLDNNIVLTMNNSEKEYIYRGVVSLIFAAIVFWLIMKFYKVIGEDSSVKRSVFGGDSGIQFITLFSIVIAVILFGILDILGANELSALLGGLSGYILGKSSASGGGTDNATQKDLPTATHPS